jgi:hypothetical protein
MSGGFLGVNSRTEWVLQMDGFIIKWTKYGRIIRCRTKDGRIKYGADATSSGSIEVRSSGALNVHDGSFINSYSVERYAKELVCFYFFGNDGEAAMRELLSKDQLASG